MAGRDKLHREQDREREREIQIKVKHHLHHPEKRERARVTVVYHCLDLLGATTFVECCGRDELEGAPATRSPSGVDVISCAARVVLTGSR